MPRKPSTPRSTVERKRTGEIKKKITVYLDVDVYRALRHWCADEDCDLSAASVIAIKRMLGEK